MADLGSVLSQKTIAIQIETKKLGVRRKVSSVLIKVRDQQDQSEETDADVLRVSKELLACPEYDAIVSLDSAFKNKLLRIALPSVMRRGVYLIPVDYIDRVDNEIRQYTKDRSELVEQFVAAYSNAVDAARGRLRTLFDPGDYPPEEAVREAFAVRAQYISVDVPQALQRLNASVFERESARLKQSMQEAAEEVRLYLRKGLMDLVSHLKERLQDDPETGKPRVLQERTLEHLKEWLSLFEGRNVTGDRELSALVEQCRRTLGGVDIDALRRPELVREQVASELGKVKESLSAMIVAKPTRKFAWDDAA